MNSFQKPLLLTVSLAIIAFSMIAAVVPVASAATCPQSRWVQVPKMDYMVAAYPEDNTTYWVFNFNTFANMKLEIKGIFPHARYMNFVLYDYNSGEMAAGEHQVLEDRDIVPKKDSYNPFMPAVDRDRKDLSRYYTISVVREDNNSGVQYKPDGTVKDNTLVIPSNLEVAAIFLRVYMPDNKDDAQGEAPLPEISVINLNTGLASPCPPQQNPLKIPDTLQDIVAGIFVPEQDIEELPDEDQKVMDENRDNVFSYNPGPDWGFYPNGNNPYLIAPLWHDTERVATVKFKAPTFTATRKNPSDEVKANDEVRYFSVCMGGYKMTNTSECFSDEELKIDTDGYVRIAVVPNGEQARFGSDQQWNVFQWGQHQYPALLFRQIGVNPDFYDHSFWNTNDAFHFDNMKDLVDNNAYSTIKEYAPTGIYCDLNDFKDNRCGQ